MGPFDDYKMESQPSSTTFAASERLRSSRVIEREVFKQSERSTGDDQWSVFSISSSSSLFILCMMVMAMKESDLMPKTMASSFIENEVRRMGEKHGFMVNVCLEVLGEDEYITEGIAMRAALHNESLKVGLRVPMLLTMAELLQWY